MDAVLSRKRKRAARKGKSGRRRAVQAGPPVHSQRPIECCRTHAAVCHAVPCWDCATLLLAESRSGLAALLGYRSVAVCDGVALPVPSVLDCLIEAEEIVSHTDFATRAGYRLAVG